MIKRLSGAVCLFVMAGSITATAVVLKAAAIASFDRYVTLTERRIDRELAPPGQFL